MVDATASGSPLLLVALLSLTVLVLRLKTQSRDIWVRIPTHRDQHPPSRH